MYKFTTLMPSAPDGELIEKGLKSQKLSPNTREFFRDVLTLSAEYGKLVRECHDSDAPASARMNKIDYEKIINLGVPIKKLPRKQEKLAFDIALYGFKEAYRLRGSQSEEFDKILGALQD